MSDKTLKVFGIGHTDISLKELGNYSMTKEQILSFYKSHTIKDYLILSTCNRVEFWGYNLSESQIPFIPSYLLEDDYAFEHMCEVGSGIASQVIGEVEILGQLRDSIKLSKETDTLGAMEGITNDVIHVSRRVRNNTDISKGVVTVGGIVSQYLKENVTKIEDNKVLIVGMGEIGRNVLGWITNENKPDIVATVNRTPTKDQVHSIEDIMSWIHIYDIVITCTKAPEAFIDSKDYDGLLIDLSVPYNVTGDVVRLEDINDIREVNIDNRLKEADKGKRIIKRWIKKNR